jgi:hypothetical protein
MSIRYLLQFVKMSTSQQVWVRPAKHSGARAEELEDSLCDKELVVALHDDAERMHEMVVCGSELSRSKLLTELVESGWTSCRLPVTEEAFTKWLTRSSESGCTLQELCDVLEVRSSVHAHPFHSVRMVTLSQYVFRFMYSPICESKILIVSCTLRLVFLNCIEKPNAHSTCAASTAGLRILDPSVSETPSHSLNSNAVNALKLCIVYA